MLGIYRNTAGGLWGCWHAVSAHPLSCHDAAQLAHPCGQAPTPAQCLLSAAPGIVPMQPELWNSPASYPGITLSQQAAWLSPASPAQLAGGNAGLEAYLAICQLC